MAIDICLTVGALIFAALVVCARVWKQQLEARDVRIAALKRYLENADRRRNEVEGWLKALESEVGPWFEDIKKAGE